MGGSTESGRWILGGRRASANPMEEAVERLGSAIRLGVYPVGAQLPPERELAGLVGVSRATLREAIRLLSEQGALEAHRGRSGGTFVVQEPIPPSLAAVRRSLAARGTSLAEILDQRWAVETAIAELAARRATPADVAALKALLPLLEAAHEDTAAYRHLDTELHARLSEAARSTRLTELLAESHRELAGLMASVPHSATIRRHSSEQHRRVVRAVERHRPDHARAAMSEHLAATASFLVGLLGVDGAPEPAVLADE